MTEYRKKVVFDDIPTQPASIQDSQEQLGRATLFDQKTEFQLATREQPETEQQISEVLSYHKPHWGIRTLALSGVALTLWQSVDAVINSISSQDWLALGWSGFISGVAMLGITAIGREFVTLQKLKKSQDTRAKLQTLLSQNGIGKAKAECERLAKQSRAELSAGYDKWQRSLAETHNDKEVFELYDGLVLSQQDKIAKKLVSKHALEAGILVALSPLATVDMLLVAWRNIYLVEQIAGVYGIKLSYWSRIGLLRLVLANMALAGASEAIADTSMDLLSVGVAGKLSSRAAQGLGVGLLTARLGFKTVALMRPLPHLASPSLKLTDVRQALLTRLTS